MPESETWTGVLVVGLLAVAGVGIGLALMRRSQRRGARGARRAVEATEPPRESPSHVGPPRWNRFAVASLVVGSLWLYGAGSILALALGYRATHDIKHSSGRQIGRGIAIAGIVLGWVGLGVAAAGFLALWYLDATFT